MTAPDMPTPLPLQPQLTPAHSVLVVEDEPMIRMITSTALTRAGFAVAVASDLATATEAVRTVTRPFDLVMLDLTLPDGEGAVAIPVIRQRSAATRVLVVSGVGEFDPSSIGADAFLAKPFTRVPLLLAVEQVLNPLGQTAQSNPA